MAIVAQWVGSGPWKRGIGVEVVPSGYKVSGGYRGGEKSLHGSPSSLALDFDPRLQRRNKREV